MVSIVSLLEKPTNRFDKPQSIHARNEIHLKWMKRVSHWDSPSSLKIQIFKGILKSFKTVFCCIHLTLMARSIVEVFHLHLVHGFCVFFSLFVISTHPRVHLCVLSSHIVSQFPEIARNRSKMNHKKTIINTQNKTKNYKNIVLLVVVADVIDVCTVCEHTSVFPVWTENIFHTLLFSSLTFI